MSKNVPTNSSLYSQVKSEAKKKFDRWPSAYGSAWLVKEYKRRGGGYRKAEQGMEVSDEMFSGYIPADMDEYKLGGGIPERYKNMGFSKVGQKKESTRSGKKWMVLAKKGDKYKVVHGGYKGMKDFTQHGSEKRKDRFWDRMGGKDSAKAKDPFSPLYWHKRLGTWAEGGEPQYAEGGMYYNDDAQDFYQSGGQTLYSYVQSAGLDPSFASRKKLLSQYVEGEYTGSAEQNLALLKKLRSGEIKLDGAKKSAGTPQKGVTTLPQQSKSKSSATTLPEKDNRQIPKTGVVIDRGTNQAFVIGNNDVASFNVLTGRSTNPNLVYSPAGIADRRNNAESAVTPTGYFLMNASAGNPAVYDGNVRGLEGIPAYGVPATPASTSGARIAIHQTYDPAKRNAYYDLGPEGRRASQGCINCNKEDYERMANMIEPSDTVFVIDSRLSQDQKFLSEVQNKKNQAVFDRLSVPTSVSYADATYVARPYSPYMPADFAMGGEWFNEDSQDFYRDGGQWIQNARKSMEEKGTVGAFTEQARREGYDDTQEFASYVLDNPGQFTNTTKKRAQFAKNMGKLNKAMRGMELNKYQIQGQTIEEPTTMLDEVTVYGERMGSNLPSKGLAPIPIEMPKLGPMPTISLPQEQQAQPTDTQTVQGKKGWGYEAMGGKDDPWWQRNVAAVAYAPGIAANFMQSAIDNRTAAKGRKNYMTDYTDDVVRQGLALSRGDYEMNTDALDVTNRTPVQFGNYFEAGGETTIDETLLKDLIAAGADIEILE